MNNHMTAAFKMKYPWILLLCLLAFFVQAQPAPSNANRTALVIGLSQYAASTGAPTLEGVPYDIDSAKRIAQAMGIRTSDVRLLQDQQATKVNILEEIRLLGERTRDGGRTFIYFSGHGTRYWDASVNACVEGLLTHDGQAITNAELAQAAQKITKNADKVITMIDACHSGGVVTPQTLTRSLGGNVLKPKFSIIRSKSADFCSKPSNVKTRSLFGESTRLGALQENVVQITSSRPDEVSFDEPGKGGLATQGVRDCLLGNATDTDGSGAVSLAEIQQCAQNSIDQKLRGAKDLTPHHVTVSGNRNLIPLQRPQSVSMATAILPSTAQTTMATAESTVSSAPSRPPASSESAVTSPVSSSPSRPLEMVKPDNTPAGPAPVVVTQQITAAASATTSHPVQTAPPSQPPAVVAAPVFPPAEPMLASLATLRDIQQQSDPRVMVDVKLSKPVLKIGRDTLEMAIKSSHDGYIYLVLLGSDRKSFYVLYPNGLDSDNFIKAGQIRKLPGPYWQLEMTGPPGEDNLLVMVAASPRKLDRLEMSEPNAKNPFTFALNEIGGRGALINFLVHSIDGESSERFGAKILTLKEVP